MTASAEPHYPEPSDSAADEDRLLAPLADYAQALRAGLPTPTHEELSAGDRARLERAQAALRRLESARPRPVTTPLPGAGEAAVLDVVCQEIQLRQELGQPANWQEYLKRFPQLADPLRARFTPDGNRDGFSGQTPTQQAPPPARQLPGAPPLPRFRGTGSSARSAGAAWGSSTRRGRRR